MRGKLTGVIGLIMVISVVAFLMKGDKNEKITEDIFCTEEALLCPDGSYTAREGAKCEFKKCPNTGPYVGRLSRKNTDFFLALKNAQNSRAAYIIPLKADPKEVPSSFLGKMVMVAGVFLDGNTLQLNSIEGMKNSY